MSLVSYALTSLAAAKSYIGGSAASGSADDEVIMDMINAASEQMIRVMGREWASISGSSQSRTLVVGDGGLVNLAPFTLRSVANITVNSETASPTALTTADYELSPFDTGMGGGYTQLRILNGYSQPGSASKTGLVTVVGAWGWATIPPTVDFLCRQQVKQWYDRDKQNRGDTLASDASGQLSYTPALGLSPAIERTLKKTYGQLVIA